MDVLQKSLLKAFPKFGEAAIYIGFGLAVLLLSRWWWNLITKYNVNHEIGEADNVSAGIAEFGILIATALIIVASLKGGRAKDVPIYIDLLISFLWVLFGFIAMLFGKLLLDLFAPFDLDKEIARDRNAAAGWLQAGFYIALALILFAVL